MYMKPPYGKHIMLATWPFIISTSIYAHMPMSTAEIWKKVFFQFPESICIIKSG